MLRLQAFLDDVGREFQLTQVDEVLAYIFENLLVQIGALKFKHILNEVISVRVLDQVAYFLDDLKGKLHLLCGTTLLEAALNDAAAVLLFTNVHTVGNAGVEDELGVLLVLLRTFRVGI